MKTTESIIKKFREEFGFIAHKGVQCDEYTVEHIEQFIKEALERVEKESLEIMIKRNAELNNQLLKFGHECCPTCGIYLKSKFLELQEKEIKTLHKTLDEVLSLSQVYVGREDVYKIFDFAFKILKKGWKNGLPVTMTFAEHWKLKANKSPEEEKKCSCHCHSEKYKNAAKDVKMKPVGCEHCRRSPEGDKEA